MFNYARKYFEVIYGNYFKWRCVSEKNKGKKDGMGIIKFAAFGVIKASSD